jgi:GTP pyrophosphokinase
LNERSRTPGASPGRSQETYPVGEIRAYDQNSLKDVSTLIADEGINMAEVKVDVSRNMATFDLTLEVKDVAELSRVLDRLENLPNVMEAQRVKPG